LFGLRIHLYQPPLGAFVQQLCWRLLVSFRSIRPVWIERLEDRLPMQ
jgi:hypothetical protein